MVDLLDHDVEATLSGTCTATVALHTHAGMIREGHLVDVNVSEGTASRAFGSGIVHFIRVAQVVDIDVCVDGVGADTGSAVVALLGHRVGKGDTAGGAQQPDEASGMAAIARAVAAERAAAAVERPQLPQLGDEPLENIRRLFDLTYADFGRLFGISERHAHRWHRSGVPNERRHLVDGLQAVGLTVVGGLGPAGARAWLRAGDPSGETLVQTGRIDELAARADAGRDSIFT